MNYHELKQKASNFSQSELIHLLGFEAALKVACEMLDNEEWDEFLQIYATKLLEEIRRTFTKKWDSNWRYDALLGYSYDIILNYDGRYQAYKRAFDKVNPPPPELLIALANCCWAPGQPPLTEEDAIMLVKQAIKNTPYIEGIELLIGLYKSIGKSQEQKYYEEILEHLKVNKIHLPKINQYLKT